MRISGSNAGYTVFRGSVKGTGYPLHSPVPPFTSPPVRHRVPSHFNWTITLRGVSATIFAVVVLVVVGGAVSITYSECVYIAVFIRHVMRTRRVILSPLACPTVPVAPHYLTKGTIL